MQLDLQRTLLLLTVFGGCSYGALLPEPRLARCIRGWILRLQPRIARHENEGSYLALCAQRVPEVRKMRVLLADDHRGLLELIRVLLEPSFDVLGAVGDGESLIEAAGKLQPDVIVTDISMPKLNGIEAVNRLRESGSPAKVVFLTVHADPDFVQAALKTGALAYVSKARISIDFLDAIRQAFEGRIFVSPMEPAV